MNIFTPGLARCAKRVASAVCGAGYLRPALHANFAGPLRQQGERGMAVGKRGVPKIRREVQKEKESRDRQKELARETKARNATDMDRHVMQAYKVAALSTLPLPLPFPCSDPSFSLYFLVIPSCCSHAALFIFH